jgi:hypothetical protein
MGKDSTYATPKESTRTLTYISNVLECATEKRPYRSEENGDSKPLYAPIFRGDKMTRMVSKSASTKNGPGYGESKHATLKSPEIDSGRVRCFDPVREARSLMRETQSAILSTHSVAEGGYPFGSLVRILLTVDRRPIMRLRVVAPHCINIQADSRISLTAAEAVNKGDQSYARATLLGTAVPVPSDSVANISELYFEKFPAWRPGERAHGHTFFWIEPVRIRYSASQGEAFWIQPEEWFAIAGGEN